jgi:hypothetical protein
MSNPIKMGADAILPSGKSGNIIKIIIIVLLLIAIGWIIVDAIGGLDKILEFLGLKTDPKKQALQDSVDTAGKNAAKPTSPWSPSFYKAAPSGTTIVTNDTALNIASSVYDSVNIFGDTPSTALGAIKQCKTQASVSYVVDVFNSVYFEDMFAFMQYHFDTSDQLKTLTQIVDYVNSLPKYNT